MIIIDNKEYNKYIIKVSWENFSVSYQGKRRTGIAPFISFDIEDKIFIGLELTFSNNMFKETKKNIKINIK